MSGTGCVVLCSQSSWHQARTRLSAGRGISPEQGPNRQCTNFSWHVQASLFAFLLRARVLGMPVKSEHYSSLVRHEGAFFIKEWKVERNHERYLYSGHGKTLVCDWKTTGIRRALKAAANLPQLRRRE